MHTFSFRPYSPSVKLVCGRPYTNAKACRNCHGVAILEFTAPYRAVFCKRCAYTAAAYCEANRLEYRRATGVERIPHPG